MRFVLKLNMKLNEINTKIKVLRAMGVRKNIYLRAVSAALILFFMACLVMVGQATLVFEVTGTSIAEVSILLRTRWRHRHDAFTHIYDFAIHYTLTPVAIATNWWLYISLHRLLCFSWHFPIFLFGTISIQILSLRRLFNYYILLIICANRVLVTNFG